MNTLALVGGTAALVILVAVSEIIAAAVPLLIVITLVPPHEREGLARLLAVCDSSRRLRMWAALRVAVKARRCGNAVR
nr:hypothetical protein [uncultured Actinoplanes sp.]